MLPGLALAETIGEVSTVFKWVGPNDKIVVEAFDDPKVSGVTCYLSRAKTGGVKGFAEAEAIGDEDFWGLPCDILVPAALGNVIDVIGPVAVVGWTFEYFKGDYAH